MDSEAVVFPEVQDAVLDAATLDQLFFDIGAAGRLVEIQIKGAETAHAAAAGASLDAARAALLAGEVFGVQLRYEYAGALWCDTLLRAAGGVRVVRTPLLTL